MLPEVNMIHMNGRVYEPTLGRFMSADPIVQAPEFSQSFNRYSYLFNNPLSGVDPTGYEGDFISLGGIQELEPEVVIGRRERVSPPPSVTADSILPAATARFNRIRSGQGSLNPGPNRGVSIEEARDLGWVVDPGRYEFGSYVGPTQPLDPVATWGPAPRPAGGELIRVAGGNSNNGNRARPVAPSPSRSIEETVAGGRVTELVQEIQTFNPRFTYEVIGGGYRQTDVVRLREKLENYQRSVNQSISVLRLDRTGKVHGEIPSYVPRSTMQESLRELSVDLRTSIQTRKIEQNRLGEDGPHRERIRQEEQLLRQIDKILGGS